jgi:hypothetical protein
MECTIYDEDEETTYSFEECMELIRKELGKWAIYVYGVEKILRLVLAYL